MTMAQLNVDTHYWMNYNITIYIMRVMSVFGHAGANGSIRLRTHTKAVQKGGMQLKWCKISCLVLLLMFIAIPLALGERADTDQSLLLPESLRIVGESAFEGTAAEAVYLPESVSVIGERAFAQMKSLREIHIPAGTAYIAPRALEGSDQAVVYGIPGSYAHQWAKRHRIPFRFDFPWGLPSGERNWNTVGIDEVRFERRTEAEDQDLLLVRRNAEEIKPLKPSEKPEMYPLDYVFP